MLSVSGESSYSHSMDRALGLPLVDRFTHYLHEGLSQLQPASNESIGALLDKLRWAAELHRTRQGVVCTQRREAYRISVS